jgi:hypothetical protein
MNANLIRDFIRKFKFANHPFPLSGFQLFEENELLIQCVVECGREKKFDSALVFELCCFIL